METIFYKQMIIFKRNTFWNDEIVYNFFFYLIGTHKTILLWK